MKKLNHTPGPWSWRGIKVKGLNRVDLGTIHGGRIFVMDFVRAGTQSALPRFQKKISDYSILERVDNFRYQKDHNGRYSIDHPDARLIAAAPEMLEALITGVETYIDCFGKDDADNCEFVQQQILAIEKATGYTWEELTGGDE